VCCAFYETNTLEHYYISVQGHQQLDVPMLQRAFENELPFMPEEPCHIVEQVQSRRKICGKIRD
jgi:hypothetical protein